MNGSAIGNLVAYTPLIESFIRYKSSMIIDFVTEGISKEAIKYDDRINKIYESKDVEELKNNEYDLVIFIGEIDVREHKFLKKLNSKYYIGSTKRFKIFNLLVEDNDKDHISQMMIDISEKVFNVKCENRYKIFLDNEEKIKYTKKLNTSKKIISINKFTSTRWKNIEDKEYIKLIKILIKKGYFVIGLYPPNEKERMNLIKREIDSVDFYFLENSKSILDSMYLMEISDLIISSDTSLVHLACGLNKPVIGLYVKSSYYEKWSPNTENSLQIVYDTGDREGKKIGISDVREELISSYVERLINKEDIKTRSIEVTNE